MDKNIPPELLTTYIAERPIELCAWRVCPALGCRLT
jgi:hypothetical protein